MQKPNMALPIYNAGRAEALGGMGKPCTDCPAVEVSKGDKTPFILYGPESVTS